MRTLLVLLIVIGFSPAALAQDDVVSQDIARSLHANVPDGFTFAAAGDLILTHPVSALKDPGLQTALDWIRHADAAFGNFENTLFDSHHFKGWPGPTTDSMRPVGTPAVAHDIKDMGFDLVSRANNHALDWGVDGMRETDRQLDAAGVVHAGTGENLAEARAARYWDSPHGRIALVSATATFEEATPALPAMGEAHGRPGASVLRTPRTVLVDTEAMQSLKRIAASMPKGSVEVGAPPDVLALFGTIYRQSDHFGYSYTANAADLAEITHAIKQAKLTSDFVVFNLHSHEPGNWSDPPAEFFPALARAAIDAGADVIVGEGPHHLRGIEIYKGKPIFYSLGNFFLQFATQTPAAADTYEKLGGTPTMTDAELYQSRIGVHIEQDSWYESVVAVTTFKNGTVAEIQLHPIELALHARMADRGIPHAAVGAQAAKILSQVADLSAPYGTHVEIKGGIGFIRDTGSNK